MRSAPWVIRQKITSDNAECRHSLQTSGIYRGNASGQENTGPQIDCGVQHVLAE